MTNQRQVIGVARSGEFMVGQVVGAVAPVIVQSATDENGLVNRLFKIVTIVAIVASIAIVALVLFLAFNIWEAVGGTVEAIGDFFLTPFNPIGILLVPLTGLISAFGARR